MTSTPPELLEQAKTLYESKESDYGESWRLTGIILANILQQNGEDELVIPAEPEYLSALGLYTRRLDKLVRSFNGTFLSDGFEVDESLSETINDQIPYAAMHTTLTQEMQLETNNSPETGHESEDVPSEYCPNCGKLSTDSTALSGDRSYEFYCGCSHVWTSST